MGYSYGLYVFPNVAALDFIGPYDVFVASNYLLKEGEIVTVAEKPDAIKCLGGMEVVPGSTFETAPQLDVLVIPGTEPSSLPLSENTVQWVRAQAERVQYVASVCSGALVLQKAGLLTNRKATTHWLCAEMLAEDPSVKVLPDIRYVRDGNIVTSQGVSAGIDMALWLVGQLHSPEHAREVRRFLHYEPAPPYTAEV